LKKRAVMSKSEFARGPLLIVQIILVAALVTALVLAAMNETDAPAAPAAPASPTSQATHSPSTAPVLATMTEIVPASTSTTEPTPTALRTETPVPTATPPREPIVRVGSGDLVFYPQKWVGPAVVRIRYEGDGPFVVWTQNNNGEREDLLANSAGAYRGDSLIDFAGSQRTLRFEVRAQEGWQLEVLPLSLGRHVQVPGAFSGNGDDSIVFDGPFVPDLLSVDASQALGPFAVWAFGQTSELVISGAAPYVGTVALPRGTTALGVKSTGSWSMEITTR
jgi:hypothetical protein